MRPVAEYLAGRVVDNALERPCRGCERRIRQNAVFRSSCREPSLIGKASVIGVQLALGVADLIDGCFLYGVSLLSYRHLNTLGVEDATPDLGDL